MVTCSSTNGYTLVLTCIGFVCVGATKFKPVNVQSFRQRLQVQKNLVPTCLAGVIIIIIIIIIVIIISDN